MANDCFWLQSQGQIRIPHTKKTIHHLNDGLPLTKCTLKSHCIVARLDGESRHVKIEKLILILATFIV